MDDVRKAAAAFTQDMKENSMEDGFGGVSPPQGAQLSLLHLALSLYFSCVNQAMQGGVL